MGAEQLLILLFKIVIIADLATLIGFVAIYTAYAPWWRDVIGRTIVTKDILLGMALTPSMLSLFLHFSRLSSLIAGWVDLGLFAGIAGVMAWRCVVWIKIHRKGKEIHPAAPEEEP